MVAPIVGVAIGAAARAVAKKAITRAGSKEATKIGQKVGQKVAESIKAPKYPSAKGKAKTAITQGKSVTTSAKGSRSVSPDTKMVQYKTKDLSEAQRAGLAKAAETKRTKTIVTAASTAKKAATPIVGKAKIKGFVAGAATGTAATTAVNKAKKK